MGTERKCGIIVPLRMANTTINSRPQQVLVVDDDASIRRALDTKFTKAGFAVTLCQNGAEGLSALQKQLFSTIILDLKMPKKNGIDVLKELSETKNAHTPVFVLTALAERCDEARELGVRRCYLKMEYQLRDIVDSICQEIRTP